MTGDNDWLDYILSGIVIVCGAYLAFFIFALVAFVFGWGVNG